MIVTLETPIVATPRVQQLRGLFDLPTSGYCRTRWDVQLPLGERPWQIGLITGPSGCGKSTVAHHLFPPGDAHLWMDDLPPWPTDRAIVDGFPEGLGVRAIIEALSAVGFSSPPAWLRPYSTQSTGQRFRCDLARLVASLMPGQMGLFDEFTSVVDRRVAQIGSAALAKAIRRGTTQFIAVTCHEDVIEWLQPDWVYRADFASLTVGGVADRQACQLRLVRPRPPIPLDIVRVSRRLWARFAPHHYLSHTLHRAATCFAALHEGQPIAFSAWINHMSQRGGKREHRTVVLPDWQGVGVGMRLSSIIASMWRGLGFRATSTTTHPALIAARRRSPMWHLLRAPSLAGGGIARGHATTRLTAGFEYVGPALPTLDAQQLVRGGLR